jgi:hypothetical protein
MERENKGRKNVKEERIKKSKERINKQHEGK